jgi:hypothetical protein
MRVTQQVVAGKQLGILEAALAANPDSEELLLVLMTQVLPLVCLLHIQTQVAELRLNQCSVL